MQNSRPLSVSPMPIYGRPLAAPRNGATSISPSHSHCAIDWEGFATPLPQTAQTGANLAPISPACHHADRYLRDSRSTGAGSRYLPARDTYLHPYI